MLLTAVFWVLVFLVGTVDDVVTPAMSFDAEGTCCRGVTRIWSSGTLPQQLVLLQPLHVVHHDTWRKTGKLTSPLDTVLYVQTFWHRLPIFQVDRHCVLHRVATSSCRGHVDELTTEPFLLLHREHGTDYRRSWNCCDRRRTCFVVTWKHFCFILSTSTGIQIDSVMRTRSSSRGRNTSDSVTVTVTTDSQHRGHDVVDIIILQHHCYFELLDQPELRKKTQLSFLNSGRPEFKNITTVYANVYFSLKLSSHKWQF